MTLIIAKILLQALSKEDNMTHKNENWLNPKGYEAFKLICSILGIGLILAILYVAVFCWVTRDTSPSSEAPEPFGSGAFYIPTVRELQEALCAAGYEVEVDCVVGEETKRQWNSYCADRMAAKYMTNTGEPK